MALNLAALASVAVAVVAAALLLRRRLAPPAAPVALAAQNVCLRCSLPAHHLTSFTCPACRHDVREAGVGPARPRSAAGPFWTVVVFTTAYVIAAAVASRFVLDALPRVHLVSRTTSMRVSSPTIQAIDINLDARGPTEHDLRGTLTAELYATGGIVLLETDLPGLRWRLVDLSGKQLDAGDRLQGEVVHKWLNAAGVSVNTAIAHSDAQHLADALGRMAGVRLELPPVPVTGRALSLSYSSNTGGSSTNVPDPRWPPALLIAASALWLALVALILRGRDGAPTEASIHPPGGQQHTAAEAAAPVAPGAPTTRPPPATEAAP